MMVNAGALFTCNMYKPYVNPRATDRELMWTGRFSGLALTGMGVVFALSVEQGIDAFLFTETIAAFMGIMFMGGVLWKRANRHGALAATLAAFAVYYVVNYRMVDELKLVYRWEAWPFAWAMLSGTAALIIVSLLTRAEDRTRIDTFFDNMQRSTDDENLPTGQPKPLAADRGQDMLLLDMPGWLTAERWRGFWRRYHEDLIGFALAWLVVAGMLLMAWGLVQIGK